MEFQLCILEEYRKGGVHNLWGWGAVAKGGGGVGLGSLKGVEAWRGLAITNLGVPCKQWFLQAGRYATKGEKPLRASVCFFDRTAVQRYGRINQL